MLSMNDFTLRTELMKEVAHLSDLCERLPVKNVTLKFDINSGADAWVNNQLVVTTKFIEEE